MKKLDKKLILKNILKNKDKIKKIGVKKLVLFGSFAKGNNTINSDLDFIVEFNDNVKNQTSQLLELTVLLEEIFERDIDIGIKNNIKKDYLSSIYENIVECIV